VELDAAAFAVLDVETTGLDANNGARICEVGSIKIKAGKEVERYHSLVHPEIPIPEDARKIHKISDEMIKDAPTFKIICTPLRQFLAGTVLIAQNASFDMGFLNAEFQRSGMTKLSIPAVDTIALARRVRPGLASYALDRLAHHFRIPFDTRHRSIGDCEVTVKVFLECLKTLRQRGEVKSVEDLVKRGGI
jgi:DNA polymerase III epsilon subunit